MLTQDEAGKPKDLDAAINHFLMAAQLDPTEIMFLINIAEAKHQQKKYAECVEFCERAVKVGKENKADAEKVEKALALQAAAENSLGDESYTKNDFESAIKHHLNAVELNPKEMMSYYDIAFIKFQQERYGECAEFCAKAVDVGKAKEKNSKMVEEVVKLHAKVENHLGMEAYRKRDLDLAIVHHLKAVELNPKDMMTLYNIIFIKFQQDKLAECVEDCIKAVRVGKENGADEKMLDEVSRLHAKVENHMGLDAYRNKDFEIAIGHHKKAVELNPREMMSIYNIAFMKFHQEKYTECVELCNEAFVVGKTYGAEAQMFGEVLKLHTKVQNCLGTLAHEKKDFETAISHYSRATELNPGEMTPFYNIAFIKFQQEKFDECLEYCARALNIGGDADLIKEVLDLQAKVGSMEAFRKNEFDTAISNYMKANELNPTDMAPLCSVAFLKFQQEKYAECIEFCVKAVEVGNTNGGDSNMVLEIQELHAKVENHLGMVAFNKGEIGTAMSHHSKAKDLNPNDMMSFYNIAFCMFQKQKFDECVDHCAKAISVGKANAADAKMLEKVNKLHAKVENHLGIEAYKGRSLDKAIAHHSKAMELDQTEILSVYNIAFIKFQQEKYDECVKFCTKAAKLGEEHKAETKMVADILELHAKVENHLGLEAYSIKEFDRAIAHHSKAAKVNPKDMMSIYNIAFIKFQQEKYEECVELCVKSANVGKSNSADAKMLEKVSELNAKVQNHLGDQAYAKDDYDLAVALYSKAAELNPRDVFYLYNIAIAKFQQEKYAECTELCKKAVELGKVHGADAKILEEVGKLHAKVENHLGIESIK